MGSGLPQDTARQGAECCGVLDAALQLVIVYTAHMWLPHTWCVQDSSIGGVCVSSVPRWTESAVVDVAGIQTETWQEDKLCRECTARLLPMVLGTVLHSVLLSEQWSG